MAIRADLKDTENYQMISGLDENGAATPLTFTGADVNVVDAGAATAIAAVETDVEAAVTELQDIETDIEGIQTWLDDYDDNAANAIKTIEYEHHEIHGGSSFTVSDVQNVDTTTLQWMVTTPDTTKWAHMLFSLECTGEMQTVITEGADRTGTNALTAINRDRNSGTAATTTAHRAVSGGSTDGATTIYSIRSGATGVASKTLFGGGARGTNEFILAQNTKYIITVTTYANVYVSLELDWYEHTNK